MKHINLSEFNKYEQDYLQIPKTIKTENNSSYSQSKRNPKKKRVTDFGLKTLIIKALNYKQFETKQETLFYHKRYKTNVNIHVKVKPTPFQIFEKKKKIFKDTLDEKRILNPLNIDSSLFNTPNEKNQKLFINTTESNQKTRNISFLNDRVNKRTINKKKKLLFPLKSNNFMMTNYDTYDSKKDLREIINSNDDYLRIRTQNNFHKYKINNINNTTSLSFFPSIKNENNLKNSHNFFKTTAIGKFKLYNNINSRRNKGRNGYDYDNSVKIFPTQIFYS